MSSTGSSSGSTGPRDTSDTGDDSSTGGLSSTTLPPGGSTTGDGFATSTGILLTGSETGMTEGTDTGDTTTGVVPGLCPQFGDEFDGRVVGPMWTTVAADAVAQIGGQTVLMLTPEENDEYPRRMLPWSLLLPEAAGSVAFRFQPAAAPVATGTQLNLVVEGPPGNDVTLSLNHPGTLQYRVTSTINNTSTEVAAIPAEFPVDGWLQATIGNGDVLFEVLDSDLNSLTIFAAVPLPFPIGMGRVGFAANNWALQPGPVAMAVEAAEVDCF